MTEKPKISNNLITVNKDIDSLSTRNRLKIFDEGKKHVIQQGSNHLKFNVGDLEPNFEEVFDEEEVKMKKKDENRSFLIPKTEVNEKLAILKEKYGRDRSLNSKNDNYINKNEENIDKNRKIVTKEPEFDFKTNNESGFFTQKGANFQNTNQKLSHKEVKQKLDHLRNNLENNRKEDISLGNEDESNKNDSNDDLGEDSEQFENNDEEFEEQEEEFDENEDEGENLEENHEEMEYSEENAGQNEGEEESAAEINDPDNEENEMQENYGKLSFLF